MARRNQPYIPLYVQDFMTDEKLMECSASATGVYIRIMCIMHKSQEYGIILLKQKDKQSVKQEENFARKIAKFLPYTYHEILECLSELISEEVLEIDGDKLIQRRMVRDSKLSDVRAEIGAEGGKKTQQFAKAKKQANTEYENEYEYEYNINNSVKKKSEIIFSDFEDFRELYPGTKRGYKVEFENLQKKHKDWREILPDLTGLLTAQIKAKEFRMKNGAFVPEWKNLSTYINNRSWEEIINTKINETTKRNNSEGATDKELADIVSKHFATDYKQ